MQLPLHATSLGSGSHSPFSIHVDVFAPVRTNPDEQLKLTLLPFNVGTLSTTTLTDSPVYSVGNLHLTTKLINFESRQ